MTPNPPNIIVLICHDLGRHLGCYGIPTVQTPHLDGFAAQGTRFARSFCVAPQCSPSRAALFTGRYPHCNGVLGLTHALFAWDLHAQEKHLATLLGEAGYHGALIGLQHETVRPEAMGFAEIVPRDALVADATLTGCDQVAAQTEAWLQTRRDSASPFYLQIGFFEPHRAPRTPHQFGDIAPDDELGVFVPPYLVDDEGARRELAAYQGAIRKLDGAVGRILEALETENLAENTLVVFTTDHGIPFPRAKCSVYDPGLETCLLMRWPRANWRQGQVVEPMIPHIDILPTLLELAGVEIPQSVQGRSFAPLLRGHPYAPRAEFFGEMTYHDYYDPVRCIRTETHKLIVAFCFNTGFMDPSQQWQPQTITVHPAAPHLSRHDIVELYDLRTDPLEHHNLAAAPEHAAVRDDLLRRLHTWMLETSDPLLEGVPPSPMHLMALAALQGEEVSQRP